jgi:hypothetical protein
MATKTPASKTARASGKANQAKKATSTVAEIVQRKAPLADSGTKIYEVSFENMAGLPVLFTVEHANKALLKDTLGEMPGPLHSSKPRIRIVNEPAQAHFKFKEWTKLVALAAPGAWYYLTHPKAFERSAKKFAKIDPLRRVLGKQAKRRNPV